MSKNFKNEFDDIKDLVANVEEAEDTYELKFFII